MTDAIEYHSQPVDEEPLETLQPRWQRLKIAVAAAPLVLATGCGIFSGDNNDGRDASPGDRNSAGPDAAGRVCVTPRQEVTPRSALNQANRDDVASQLAALQVAHHPRQKVTVLTVVNAGSIIANTLRDPVYARAFADADQHPTEASNAGRLLKRYAKPSSYSRQECRERWQVDTADDLYRSLLKGLAPKTGRQMSAAARVFYDRLRGAYKAFHNDPEQGQAI